MATATQRDSKTQKANAAIETIVNDAPRMFTDAEFPVGTAAHQGDLILIRIAHLPTSAKRRTDRQLAIGNAQGSRHILKRGTPYNCDAGEVAAAIKLACPKSNVGEQYIGPVFTGSKGSANLTHPEHGNHTYYGDMTIAVVYQRNQDADERERRTQD